MGSSLCPTWHPLRSTHGASGRTHVNAWGPGMDGGPYGYGPPVDERCVILTGNTPAARTVA